MLFSCENGRDIKKSTAVRERAAVFAKALENFSANIEKEKKYEKNSSKAHVSCHVSCHVRVAFSSSGNGSGQKHDS